MIVEQTPRPATATMQAPTTEVRSSAARGRRTAA
jgi:hypothetical protein